jgi:hypothetical protein
MDAGHVASFPVCHKPSPKQSPALLAATPTPADDASMNRAMQRKAAHDCRRGTDTASPSSTPRRKSPAAPPPGMKRLLVTTAQTRGLLGIGDTKLWQLISDGTLETVKLDCRRMVVFESIERFTNALRQREIDRPRSTHADKAIASSAAKRRMQRARQMANAATRRAGSPP